MKSQKGIGLLGGLFYLFLFLFFSLTVVKLTPVYVEYYNIKASLKSLTKDVSSDEFSNDIVLNTMTLKRKLLNQLDINGINSIEEKNITVQYKNDTDYEVTVKYQEIQPYFYNVKLLFDFTLKQEVDIGSQS